MAIKQGNLPFRVPYPANTGMIGQSFIAKVIISADTTLVVDTDDEFFYNLLLNDSADADTDLDIPCFLLPSGTMIEDIGFHRFQANTAAAHLILGDTADSDGWIDTVIWATASGTDAIGIIQWGSQFENEQVHQSSALVDDTTFSPAYLEFGPRVVYSDSAYSTATVVGLDSDDEPRPHEYAIHVRQKEAVNVTGGVAIYLKYNFSPLQLREPSSNLGDTGD